MSDAHAVPERLAMLRIIVVGFVTAYLLVRAPAFLGLADNDPGRFRPVGLVRVLDRPLEGSQVPFAFVLIIALGLAATVGWRYRVTGPGFAVLTLALLTYRSSWGQILWFEILMALQLLVVGLSPAADAISLDDRRRGRPDMRSGVRYAWPLQLVSIITVVTYLVAGIAKLRYGGLAWVDGDVLRNHVAFSAARLEVLGATPSPLAEPFLAAPVVASVFSIGAVVLELAAPVALVRGWVRTTWVVATWLMHVVIAATMFVVFPFPLFGAAFASFFALERLHARMTA